MPILYLFVFLNSSTFSIFSFNWYVVSFSYNKFFHIKPNSSFV